MNFALSTYHALPDPLRSGAASLRGYYLNWWRYNKGTDGLVEKVLERDTWTEQEWEVWRSKQLAYVLERAATRVPFYRNQWQERRRLGDHKSWEDLNNWPVLEKEDLRKDPRSFVADDSSTRWMFHDHTSGTTGTSLDLWLTRATVNEWYAMFEARWRRWYGLTRHDRWAILGGQMVIATRQNKPPFWVWNAGLNQLYMSSYHLSPSLIPHYLDALVRYRVRYIWAYSSAVYSLAQEVLRRNRKDIRLETVITNAEPLYEHQRATIAEAFGCQVRETYGMAEMVTAASECDLGNLHQWPDAGVVEAANPQSETGMSELVCTGLVNADMPLIRYRVGDCARISQKKCACGRLLPLIDAIDGRFDDLLYTSDGRQIGRLDPVFKNDLPIIESQIVQVSLNSINVRYVPAADFHASALGQLAARVRERLGDIAVTFEPVASIPRTKNGKFRAVICDLSADELRSIRGVTELPVGQASF